MPISNIEITSVFVLWALNNITKTLLLSWFFFDNSQALFYIYIIITLLQAPAVVFAILSQFCRKTWPPMGNNLKAFVAVMEHNSMDDSYPYIKSVLLYPQSNVALGLTQLVPRNFKQ